jgi:hypothetical protein
MRKPEDLHSTLMLGLWRSEDRVARSLRYSHFLMVHTRNGFTGGTPYTEAKSPLVKYDAYLLIRSKLYPHYAVHFFLRGSATGLLLFCRLVAIERRGQSTAHLQRDSRRSCGTLRYIMQLERTQS